MKNAVSLLFYFIINLAAFSLSAQNPIVIDWEEMQEQDIMMSSLFSKVEYVPLQFVKEHPVDGHYRLFVKDDYILVLGMFEHIYMFDRKDGHFIKEVSRAGGGPEEYRKLVFGTPFCPQKEVVFVDQFKKWKGINVRTGKVVIEVDRPSTYYAETQENQAPISNLFWYDFQNDLFLGYPNNVTGDYPDMLVLFDRKGEIKKKYPNHHFFQARRSLDVPNNPGMFYRYRDEVYFKVIKDNLLQDTVYRVGRDRLTAHVVLKLPNEQSGVDYKQIPGVSGAVYADPTTGSVRCVEVSETERYLFFRFFVTGQGVSWGYYDKKTKKSFRTPAGKEAGLSDDIHGLLPFLPMYYNGKQLVGSIDPDLLLERNAAHSLTQVSAEGKSLIGSLQFDDNPVVVIATLKHL